MADKTVFKTEGKVITITAKDFEDNLEIGHQLNVSAKSFSPFRDGMVFLKCQFGENGQASVLIDGSYIDQIKASKDNLLVTYRGSFTSAKGESYPRFELDVAL